MSKMVEVVVCTQNLFLMIEDVLIF